MPYEVYMDDNLIHYTGDTECVLIDPVVKTALNDAGTFEFSISPTHEYYDCIFNRKSVVKVFRDGKEIFCGEVREQKRKSNKEKQVYCVDELAFLYDSVQPQAEYHDISPRELLDIWLDNHNEQMVNEHKKFYTGIVTVHDNNDSIYRITNFETTLDDIKSKLIGTLGGYLKIRKSSGKKYIDWLTLDTYGKQCKQTIEFGDNLIDYSENITSDDICTALIPLGAKIEQEITSSAPASDSIYENYVDVTSVNGGKNVIQLDDAVNHYGFICRILQWEDVNIPSNLLKKGKQWLIDNQYESMTLTIKAIDMSILSSGNFDSWELGDKVKAVAEIYGMNRFFPVSEMNTYLDAPEKNTVILGSTVRPTLSSSSNNTIEQIQEEAEKVYKRTQWLQSAIDNATQMLTGSKGGYRLDEYDENGLFLRTLYMDAPNKNDAINIIQIGPMGIGISNNGYAGPYESAWTIDGVFLGKFIKAHSIKAEALETEYIESVEKQIEDAETGAKEWANDEITTQIKAVQSQITLSVETERLRASGVEEKLSSRITVNQNSISSEVSRATGAENVLSSKITQTENSILSEVIRAKNAESTLSSQIKQTADNITLCVKTTDFTGNSIISKINMSSTTATISASKVNINADDIRLKAGKLAWSSTYSTMTSNGKLTCKDVQINGGTMVTASGSDKVKVGLGMVEFGRDSTYGSYIRAWGNANSLHMHAQKTIHFSCASMSFEFNGVGYIAYSGTKNGLTFVNGICVV